MGFGDKIDLFNQSVITPGFCTETAQPGKYTITLTLVQEHVKWFNDTNAAFAVNVEVEIR